MVFGDGGGPGEATGDRLGELVLASASGDRDAFARLYELVAPRSFGLVSRIVPEPAEAEAVLRDAFADVWRTAGEYDPRARSGRAWVLGVVHRRAVAHRGDRSGGGAVEPADTRVEGRRMVRAFGALSDDQRAALALAYLGGRSEAELAALTGSSIDTVRARLRDGLSRVRSELGILS